MPEFLWLVLDEIYTFVGQKGRKFYIFTAYGMTDLGYVVRFAHVYQTVCSYNLRRFLKLLPPAQAYFSDGASMYGTVLGNKVLQEKNAMTNLVESFNSQLRQYLSNIRRKTKGYAKTHDGLARQIARLILRKDWLTPKKPHKPKPKNKTNP